MADFLGRLPSTSSSLSHNNLKSINSNQKVSSTTMYPFRGRLRHPGLTRFPQDVQFGAEINVQPLLSINDHHQFKTSTGDSEKRLIMEIFQVDLRLSSDTNIQMKMK
ncbi:hypothetical protein O181_014856 [Austropuccinia psidii MF-1]|uniref:Uncharacterized protein n=1 Tax=Austropuccinia psidii MF-1 TaxID=1389203 RepID=A0A9Q3BYW6_9BASI|nr:hypothetical protein [Austropuccinia psidii MF-1]